MRLNIVGGKTGTSREFSSSVCNLHERISRVSRDDRGTVKDRLDRLFVRRATGKRKRGSTKKREKKEL